jgi:hypothetical protein
VISKVEAERLARVDSASISAYLDATGWQAVKAPPNRPVKAWRRLDRRGPGLLQLLEIADDLDLSQQTLMLQSLAEAENRPPQAILWDWQAASSFRLRLTAHPRLASEMGSELLATERLLEALYHGFRQAALQVERYKGSAIFRAAEFLRTLRLLPHDSLDVDLLIGSRNADAQPVCTEFLALLARPATPITPRRELEPSETHYVLEPLGQAMKEAGITDLSGQYLAAGEPNVAGTGLLFRLSAEGGILMGGDD